MTDAKYNLMHYLRTMREMRRQMKMPPEFHYCGMEDFLLQHGQWYDVRPWDGRYKQGVPKMCFGNAVLLGVSDSLRYVEGVAMYALNNRQFFPVHHGWNLDQQGYVIDATWCNTGECYFGVEFSVGRADDATWNGDNCVLDDYGRGHPLFRQPWAGEDFDRIWPDSEGMMILRDGISGKFDANEVINLLHKLSNS